MSDFARLEEILGKLRAKERVSAEGRKLKGGDAAARLASLVAEIDETILPRRLTFRYDDQNAVHLAVANRRLQALVSPVPKHFDSDLADQELADAKSPGMVKLGELLSGFLSETGTVTIASRRPETSYGSDVGVPAAQLARVWDISTGKFAKPSDLMDRFLKSLKKDAIAWLRIEGEAVIDQGGNEAEVERLGEQAAVFLDGYFSKFEVAFREPSRSCATLIAPAKKRKAAMLFIEYDGISAFVEAKPQAILEIAGRWQDLVVE